MMKYQTAETPHYSNKLWRIRLFDGPLLETLSGEEIKRFRSLKVGALLAYLALRLGRPCPREELYLAIWPEENDTQIVANRLRVALASLRRQIEPPGIPFGTVLDVSTAGRICLREATVWCDIAAFEQAFKAGQKTEAARLLKGTLLPGYYDDWIILERERLETLSEQLALETVSGQIPEEPVAPTIRREGASAALYSLPLYLTRGFGREEAKQQILEMVCEKRLVTITGPGGMGKTRLAVETAQRMSSPAVFVALAEVTEGEQTAAQIGEKNAKQAKKQEGEHVTRAILRALGVLPSAETDLIAQLITIFRRRESFLLILDNAEHLLKSVAEVTMRLLAAVPDLTLLVTSRERLNIAGETVLPLASLKMPSLKTPYDHLIETPAVALFLHRARNARPDFVLSPRYADAMLQICLLLEGVPLALELAAARVVMQTPAQIADALSSGLLRLKSQQHGLSARHRSLRASIQGSYDLLPSELQAFFNGLSIFQGGWTAEAARFVTGCPETEEFLEDLARRSLLVIEEDEAAGVMRCAFLESIRQFAAERLTAVEQESLVLRHAEYFLGLAAAVTEDDIRSLLPLDSEQENLLIALETGWKRQTTLFPAGLIGVLYYAYIRGYNRIFLTWAERSLTIRLAVADIRERVRLDIALYLILGYVGKYDLVLRLGETMLREAKEHDFLPGSVVAKLILCYCANHWEDYETMMRLSSEALQEARMATETGSETGTEASKEKSLLFRTLRLAAWYWEEFAVRMPETEGEAARALFQQCEALVRECLSILPARSSQRTFTLTILSRVHFKLGNTAEGYARLKEAQKTALAHGMQVMLIFCCQTECIVAIENDRLEYAALLDGAYRALREKTGYTFEGDGAASIADISRRLLIDRLGRERYEALAQRGEQTSSEEMAALSLQNLPSFAPEETVFLQNNR